ncbi:MAG: sulfatase-like hydrolase/transferase [Acidimicrobiales bacterium]
MSDEAPGRRPNVLFIITDQQRADHVGFAGNEIVQTPNLDALAARGTVFDSAWVANPVCMPNRSTIMTGRMPTAHGVIFNDRSLDWGANTFVRQFLAAGWRTALIGKSHLQHGLSRNAVVPIGSSGAFDDPWPPGWNTLEDHESFADGPPDFPPSFYGFEHVELSIDHGSRITGHHLQWALDRGGVYEQLVVPMTDEAPAKRRSDRWWQVYEPPYGPELHSTTFVAEQTSAFIEEAAAGGSPWLVMASFPDPHHPMTPPKRMVRPPRPGRHTALAVDCRRPGHGARLPPSVSSAHRRQAAGWSRHVRDRSRAHASASPPPAEKLDRDDRRRGRPHRRPSIGWARPTTRSWCSPPTMAT